MFRCNGHLVDTTENNGKRSKEKKSVFHHFLHTPTSTGSQNQPAVKVIKWLIKNTAPGRMPYGRSPRRLPWIMLISNEPCNTAQVCSKYIIAVVARSCHLATISREQWENEQRHIRQLHCATQTMHPTLKWSYGNSCRQNVTVQRQAPSLV